MGRAQRKSVEWTEHQTCCLSFSNAECHHAPLFCSNRYSNNFTINSLIKAEVDVSCKKKKKKNTLLKSFYEINNSFNICSI